MTYKKDNETEGSRNFFGVSPEPRPVVLGGEVPGRMPRLPNYRAEFSG